MPKTLSELTLDFEKNIDPNQLFLDALISSREFKDDFSPLLEKIRGRAKTIETYSLALYNHALAMKLSLADSFYASQENLEWLLERINPSSPSRTAFLTCVCNYVLGQFSKSYALDPQLNYSSIVILLLGKYKDIQPMETDFRMGNKSIRRYLIAMDDPLKANALCIAIINQYYQQYRFNPSDADTLNILNQLFNCAIYQSCKHNDMTMLKHFLAINDSGFRPKINLDYLIESDRQYLCVTPTFTFLNIHYHSELKKAINDECMKIKKDTMSCWDWENHDWTFLLSLGELSPYDLNYHDKKNKYFDTKVDNKFHQAYATQLLTNLEYFILQNAKHFSVKTFSFSHFSRLPSGLAQIIKVAKTAQKKPSQAVYLLQEVLQYIIEAADKPKPDNRAQATHDFYLALKKWDVQSDLIKCIMKKPVQDMIEDSLPKLSLDLTSLVSEFADVRVKPFSMFAREEKGVLDKPSPKPSPAARI